MNRQWLGCLLAGLVLMPTAGVTRAATLQRPARPLRVVDVDNSQYLDINRIRMWVTNTGSFAWDKTTGNAGLEFPKGSTRTAVFAAGLWIGGQVGGSTRVAVSEYSDEYGPGPMIGGVAAPDDPLWRVYRLNRVYPSTAARDAALADYETGAEPYGAPDASADGALNISGILGDQMAWAVYNDADPAFHNNRAGGTTPLGVEVQQTTFAFNRSGPVGQASAALGQTIFIRYKIINKGGNTIDNMYVSQWSDPDLGGFTDDLVGCDPGPGVGFVYNATNNDGLYGSEPPSVGYDFFQGPLLPDNTRLPMTSFNKYTNATDPDNSSKTYNYMLGLNADGTPAVNPATGLVTPFFVSGDPVFGTGWLDTAPGDRRLMLSSGPFTLAPNDTQEVVTGIIVGDGSDRLASISLMKYYDTVAQSAFEQNFNLAFPPDPPSVLSSVTDRTITLTWDRGPETYDQAPYGFEGYVVYQGETSCGPWRRVATYDVPNNITTVLDPAFDAETGAVLQKVSALGTNSGLRYTFTTTQDFVLGGPLHAGTPYYFVVTAYSVALLQVPQVLESAQPCNVAPIIPQTAAAGIDLSAARVVSGPTRSRVDPGAGPPTNDNVTVTVLDPSQVKAASYRVGYKLDSFGNLVWYLDRTIGATTVTLLDNQTNFTGNATYEVVDGILVKVLGASYGTPPGALLSVDYVDTGPNPPAYVGFGGSLALTFFGGSADYVVNMPLGGLSSMLDPADPTQFTGAEIRLTGGTPGQKAYRYIQSDPAPRSYPYTDYVDVPFTVWDTDANRQLNCGLFEFAGANPPEPDAIWNPDTFGEDPFSKREWMYIFKSTYSGDATPDPFYTTTYPNARFDSANLDFQYVLWPAQAVDAGGAPIPVDAGDKVVFTRLNRSTNDYFTFSTSAVTTFSEAVAKSELSRVNVVPNPYFAHSRYEQTQFDRVVKFTHLPARCTIRIFNLAGDLIRTLVKDDASTSQMAWDLQTDRALPIGSGIYVFHVEAPGIGEKVGKVALFLEKERLTNF